MVRMAKRGNFTTSKAKPESVEGNRRGCKDDTGG